MYGIDLRNHGRELEVHLGFVYPFKSGINSQMTKLSCHFEMNKTQASFIVLTYQGD